MSSKCQFTGRHSFFVERCTGFGVSFRCSERELEIVRAVADGLSNKEIAGRLFISEGTVKNYITSILANEGLSHRTALAVYYLAGKKQS